MTNALLDRLRQASTSSDSSRAKGAMRRAAPGFGNSIAGWVGVISACGVVVIARRYHRCTDGCGTDAYAYAAANIGSAIGAATITRVDASNASAARTSSASIR
jgi:hypothetical protein